MEVTQDLVRHIARISRLAVSPAEVSELGEHFRKILAYVAELQALLTDDVDPSHFAVEDFNVYASDEPAASLGVEEALRNAPQATAPYFVVPRIVGGASQDALGSQEAEEEAP